MHSSRIYGTIKILFFIIFTSINLLGPYLKVFLHEKIFPPRICKKNLWLSHKKCRRLCKPSLCMTNRYGWLSLLTTTVVRTYHQFWISKSWRNQWLIFVELVRFKLFNRSLTSQQTTRLFFFSKEGNIFPWCCCLYCKTPT